MNRILLIYVKKPVCHTLISKVKCFKELHIPFCIIVFCIFISSLEILIRLYGKHLLHINTAFNFIEVLYLKYTHTLTVSKEADYQTSKQGFSPFRKNSCWRRKIYSPFRNLLMIHEGRLQWLISMSNSAMKSVKHNVFFLVRLMRLASDRRKHAKENKMKPLFGAELLYKMRIRKS